MTGSTSFQRLVSVDVVEVLGQDGDRFFPAPEPDSPAPAPCLHLAQTCYGKWMGV